MAADTIGGGTNEDGSLQNTLVLDESDAAKIDVTPLYKTNGAAFVFY